MLLEKDDSREPRREDAIEPPREPREAEAFDLANGSSAAGSAHSANGERLAPKGRRGGGGALGRNASAICAIDAQRVAEAARAAGWRSAWCSWWQ